MICEATPITQAISMFRAQTPILQQEVGHLQPILLLLHQAIVEEGPAPGGLAPEDGHVVLARFVADHAMETVGPWETTSDGSLSEITWLKCIGEERNGNQ